MVKRIALLLAFFSVASFAASPKPADVATPVGLTPTYNTTNSNNIPVNPLVTPPTFAGLTNIPIPSETGRIITSAPKDETSPAGNFCKTLLYGGVNAGCTENKFRTHVDYAGMGPNDPIRNYCQPGTSHLHIFFGQLPNACSTYKSLRQHALSSAAAGTDANGTAYWAPAIVVVNPFSNGKNYALKLNYVVVYYTNDNTLPKARVPVGKRYVFGFDMDATTTSYGSGVTGGQYSWLQTALDTANGTIGHARYTLADTSGNLWGRAAYHCEGATPEGSAYIVKPDGTDPHAGTCASGADYWIAISGSACWNGKDAWSDGGYKHFIPKVWDNDKSEWVCPTNYYLLPELSIQIHYTQYGWTDRQKWVLSSDLSYRAANSLNSTQVPAGFTFHTDWMDGWDHDIMNLWQDNCVGTLGNTGHQCDSGALSSTKGLALIGSPGAGGRNPQVDFTALAHVNASDVGWIEIPTSWNSALSGHHMHS